MQVLHTLKCGAITRKAPRFGIVEDSTDGKTYWFSQDSTEGKFEDLQVNEAVTFQLAESRKADKWRHPFIAICVKKAVQVHHEAMGALEAEGAVEHGEAFEAVETLDAFKAVEAVEVVEAVEAVGDIGAVQALDVVETMQMQRHQRTFEDVHKRENPSGCDTWLEVGRAAKLHVFWDMDNLSVPRKASDVHTIFANLKRC